MIQFVMRKTEDTALVSGLHSQIFPNDDWDLDVSGHMWVASHGDLDVGFFCLSAKNPLKSSTLTRIGVIDDFRGNGIIPEAMMTIRAFCVKTGIKHVETYCTDWNVGSAVGLLKAGFVIHAVDDGNYMMHRRIKK